ncbi:MAG: TetR/AcrR family transcriptional regulator [Verrucomicrobiota bacterium]
MNHEAHETKALLLDTAEKMFGDLGFDGVGLRALAEEADLNLGAVTYHFGSKANLYTETFLRRFRTANRERFRLLGEAEERSAGEALPLEVILECFLWPPLEITGQHPSFFRLMLRNLVTPPPFMEDRMCQEMKPVIERFLPSLSASLPRLSGEEIMTRFRFCGGALLVSAGNLFGPEPKLDQVRSTEERRETLANLISFCAAGLRGSPVTLSLPQS